MQALLLKYFQLDNSCNSFAVGYSARMTPLAKYIERSGLTQSAVGDAVGVSYPTVSDWVRGVKRPRPERVAALAKVLAVPESELYSVLYSPRKNRR